MSWMIGGRRLFCSPKYPNRQWGPTQFAIAFKLCIKICHFEASGKPGGLEIKWYTSASGLF